jgi:hypothetical protein
MTQPSLAETPVHSAAELTARWAGMLVQPPAFESRTLWLTWLDGGGRSLPVVLPVEDLPRIPDAGLLQSLVLLHDGIADGLIGGGHLAMALSRPGGSDITEDDREWEDALHETLDAAIEGTWSVHLAAGGSVVPMVEGLT